MPLHLVPLLISSFFGSVFTTAFIAMGKKKSRSRFVDFVGILCISEVLNLIIIGIMWSFGLVIL